MVKSIHHVGLVVDDLDRLVAFYCELLRLTEVGRIESVAPPEGNHTGIPGARRTLVFLGVRGSETGAPLIELVHYHDPVASEGHLGKHQMGASHICFMVDDLQGEYDRLSTAGVQFETPPCFSNTAAGRLGVIYGRDPEGNWFELIEGTVQFDNAPSDHS